MNIKRLFIDIYKMASTTKASKKSKVLKTEPVVSATPTPPPVVAPAVTEPVLDNVVATLTSDTPLSELFANSNKTLHDLSTAVALMKAELRAIEKLVTKELKTLDKFNAKKNKNKGNRAPSGFVKPTKITDELADFLSKEHGSLMARTDVTKQMTAYIRKNNLQDKTNGRIILPDAKLQKLLKITKADSLTYFNLQKYMSPHFEKSVPVAAKV
jgi:chromatin remodeling complex protein RSC6